MGKMKKTYGIKYGEDVEKPEFMWNRNVNKYNKFEKHFGCFWKC